MSAPLMVFLLLMAGSMIWFARQLNANQARNIVIGVMILQLLWIPLKWRASVYAFIVYVVVEGFILNFFSDVPALNLVKDALVGMLFAVLAVSTVTRRIFPIPWTGWFLPFSFFALVYFVQVFNPKLPNLLVGLIGLRVMLFYALLAPVAYWFFDRRERVLNFFLFVVMLSIPVSAFGIFQYFAGPGWLISLSPGFARAIFFAIGDPTKGELLYFRTLSTFVSTGSFSNYLWFMLACSVALFNMKGLRAHRVWILFALALQFLALLTSGGRAPFVYFLISVMLLLVLRRKTFRAVPALALLVILFIVGINILGPVIGGRFGTITNLEQVQARNVPLAVGWLVSAMSTDFMGFGAGYATVASRHAGITELNQTPVENMLARVRFETGILGFVAYLVFLGAALVTCVRTPSRLQDSDLAWPAAACSAFVIVNLSVSLPFGTPFDISPNNVFIWFCLGFLSRVPHLAAAVEYVPEVASANVATADAEWEAPHPERA